MKKTLLTFFLLIIIKTSNAQITYFDYLDYTSEWRNYGGGWNGVYFIEEYATTYFDGDTIINGNTYYKRYIYSNTNLYTSPAFNLYLTGPTFIREDNAKKFYEYSPSSNTESVVFDNQIVIGSIIGDPYPAPGAICSISLIDTIYLGTRPLKHIRGINYTPSGQLEGIGTVGASCALGTEGGGNLVCYIKSGQNIQFNSMNCNLFPTPLRTSITNTIPEKLNIAECIIYPNPTNNILNIKLNKLASNQKIFISNLLGELIYEMPINNKAEQINVSTFDNGIYFVHIIGDNIDITKKIIKQ